MSPHRFIRMLGAPNSSTTTTTTASTDSPPPELDNVDSDFLLILAALLCALICVLGLLAVSRCTWIRRISTIGRTDNFLPASANKGVKKKILNTLPKLTYSTETMADNISDCAICLTEFTVGDEIRVLPQCGHSFHVTCVDTWFGSHSSCPSCRQILVAAPVCKKCGDSPAAGFSGSQTTPAVGETSASIDRHHPEVPYSSRYPKLQHIEYFVFQASPRGTLLRDAIPRIVHGVFSPESHQEELPGESPSPKSHIGC